jgi:NAD(P)-dependent dehydrogenase (short-subunit alcohol dehydrogenase family)
MSESRGRFDEVIHGVHTFLPILQANDDGGHIVNTASMAGLVAPPRPGAYSVTKFGVVALTEVLAAELAQADSKVGATVGLGLPVGQSGGRRGGGGPRDQARRPLRAHPDWYPMVERRHAAIAAAFGQPAG